MRVRNWLLSIINAIRIRLGRRQQRWFKNQMATRNQPIRRMVATAVLTPMLVAGSYGDQPLFPGQEYQVGDFPRSFTTGDFNGDGVTDLATANNNSDNVSVLLGEGEGAFAIQTSYAASNGAFSVTTGDFNGDGLSDLAIADLTSDNVSVLLNQSSSDVSIGDVNKDGVTYLLDVEPFIAAIVSGEFQAEADINGDGEVHRLDVAPFVDLLSGG